jgi:hypothetical protein
MKNKLFAASTMKNLRPHSPAQNSATQNNLVSRSEGSNAAHIITLNRQNNVSALNVFGTKVLAATRRQRFTGIPKRVADTQFFGTKRLASTRRWRLS